VFLLTRPSATKQTPNNRCKGFGHIIRDCPNKRTFIIRDNGEYSSASDSEETIYVLLATKSNFDDVRADNLPCYALVCSDMMFSLDNAPSLDIPPAVTKLL
jgi:hypothetical protein